MTMTSINTTEIECRFLEIDKESLIKKLRALGAKDDGEMMLEEIIIYEKDTKWQNGMGFLRLRNDGKKISLTYKEHNEHTVDGTYEIELAIDDYKKAELLLEKVGLQPYRHQQKLRHSFHLNGVTFDIDTWPKIPTYVEIEGSSEEDLKKAAESVGFEWKNVDFHNARHIIENKYNIPVGDMTWFTFDRFE
jgi:adenylate cyclase class 2